MRALRSGAVLVLVVLFPVVASAVLVVDQQQPAFDTSYEPLEIGGPMDRRYGQIFTVGIEGWIAEVHLPVQCESGVLTVEIYEVASDLPVGFNIDVGTMEAALLPPVDPPVFRTIRLEVPIPPGSRFPTGSASWWPGVGTKGAVVVSNPTGRCTLFRAVGGDPYSRGEGFFDERPKPRGWLPLDGNIEPSHDLAFKIVLEADPPVTPCDLHPLSSNPRIPNFLPVCRCLEDDLLREQRCALFDPSFFLIRTVPFPIIPGVKFEVSWTLVPLTELTGDVEITDSMKGFQSLQKKPLVFRPGKPGRSDTLKYSAVGAKEGTFTVDSVIRSPSMFGEPDLIRMQSLIEVELPPKQ